MARSHDHTYSKGLWVSTGCLHRHTSFTLKATGKKYFITDKVYEFVLDKKIVQLVRMATSYQNQSVCQKNGNIKESSQEQK